MKILEHCYKYCSRNQTISQQFYTIDSNETEAISQYFKVTYDVKWTELVCQLGWNKMASHNAKYYRKKI